MFRWIDSHCHLDAAEFGADRAQARARAASAGVACCVLPAVDIHNFDTVRALAHQYGDAYALGIHPLCTPRAGDADLERLEQALARHAADPRLVAVGEIGIDLFVPGLDPQRQDFFLRGQLKLARAHGLPVILHVRRSADRLLKHLRDVGAGRPWSGIAHAFNGSRQQAGRFIDMGFKLGFGGAMTHERALQLRRLARELPLSALVLETDSPDIPPEWIYRTAQLRASGVPQARNEPAELPRIGQALAGLRGLAPGELAQALLRNTLQALPRLADAGAFPGLNPA